MTELFWALLVLVLHLSAAIGVTAHVLLNLRDVRSSIGWIGLVWLSPFIGSAIYAAFGINRVARRGAMVPVPGRGRSENVDLDISALSKNTPPQIKLLAKAGGAISGLELTTGNRFETLINGDEAYPRMITEIDSATKSIALSSYIFADDEWGRSIADALARAHERGCAVRVLIDGIGGGYFKSGIADRLRAAGVPTERFLHEWLPWDMPFINLRNHKKILVVDGVVGFTGGMNLAAKNVGGADLPKVQDVSVRVEGSVVHHFLRSFAADWAFTTDEKLEGDIWWPSNESRAQGMVMRGLSSGPDEGVGRVEAFFASAVEQAEKRVRVVTPYFLPEERLLAVLRRAALRGVQVEILVPEVSNHFYFDWAMHAHLRDTKDDGLQIYEIPPPFDHSKLMTVDGQWMVLGSANWDARSMRLNFEFLLEGFGKTAAKKIDAIIDEKLARAKKLDLDDLNKQPLLVHLRDAAVRLLLPYL